MKIAYVDIELSGHHVLYLKELFNTQHDAIAILPSRIKELPYEKQYIIPNTVGLHNHPSRYFNWLNETYKIISKEKVDIVHFLYGDAFARYFGLGLSKFNKYNPIVTFHQFRRNWIKDLSIKCVFQRIRVGVVHTKFLEESLSRIGVKNLSQIEYPSFVDYREFKLDLIRKNMGIKDNQKVLLMIGAITKYKGLDLLVDALEGIDDDFLLIVAGYNSYYTCREIDLFKQRLKEKIFFDLKFLSDDEYVNYLLTSDIVLLPYMKTFDGASGPLVDAVSLSKPVIASNHGSLGCLVRENDLGLLFECEDVNELRSALCTALRKGIKLTEKSEKYRQLTQVDNFVKSYKELYNSK